MEYHVDEQVYLPALIAGAAAGDDGWGDPAEVESRNSSLERLLRPVLGLVMGEALELQLVLVQATPTEPPADLRRHLAVHVHVPCHDEEGRQKRGAPLVGIASPRASYLPDRSAVREGQHLSTSAQGLADPLNRSASAGLDCARHRQAGAVAPKVPLVPGSTAVPIVGRGHLDQTACQEQLSFAYCRAVAAAAGCSFEPRDVDMYSVDATFHHSGKLDWSPKQLEAQLKCTTQDVVKDDHVAWQLDRQAYDRLSSAKVSVPAVLIVLTLPPKMDDWLVQSPAQLLLAGEAYWMSLRGAPSIESASKVVHLPRTQVFGVQPLLDIMDRIGQGGLP